MYTQKWHNSKYPYVIFYNFVYTNAAQWKSHEVAAIHNLKVKLNIIVIIMNIFQMSFTKLLAYRENYYLCPASSLVDVWSQGVDRFLFLFNISYFNDLNRLADLSSTKPPCTKKDTKDHRRPPHSHNCFYNNLIFISVGWSNGRWLSYISVTLWMTDILNYPILILMMMVVVFIVSLYSTSTQNNTTCADDDEGPQSTNYHLFFHTVPPPDVLSS